MKIGTMALIGSAMAMALGGMTAVACSSNNGSGTPSNPEDSGTIATDSGITITTDSGVLGTDSGVVGTDSGVASADAGCSSKPPNIVANSGGDVYCGFASDDAGGDLNCLSDGGTPMCCLGGEISSGTFAPQACVPFGSTCTTGTASTAGQPIQCNQVSDCTSNGTSAPAACCLRGASAAPGIKSSSCDFYYLSSSHTTGIFCEGTNGTTDGGNDDAGDAGINIAGEVPTCAAGEVQICNTNTDCPTGKTCTPMKWSLFSVGFCM